MNSKLNTKLDNIKKNLSNDYTVSAQDGIIQPVYNTHKNIYSDTDVALTQIAGLAKQYHLTSVFKSTLITNNIVDRNTIEEQGPMTRFNYSQGDIDFVSHSSYTYFSEHYPTNLLTPIDAVDFIDDFKEFLSKKSYAI